MLAKLFADDTSLFSTVRDPAKCAKVLNDDLLKVSNWAFKWKMIFNPDVTKQAQEVTFIVKVKKQITQLSILMKPLLKKNLVKNILECI